MSFEDRVDELSHFEIKVHKKRMRLLQALKGKRQREEESEEEKSANPPPPPPSTVVAKPAEELFLCAGHVWKNPPVPCPGGDKSMIRDGISVRHEGQAKNKNYTVCRSCKNTRDREKKKAKAVTTTTTTK